MTWEENDYLIHYGIKGQKKGVRRFQNDDGTLTAEGRARYKGMYNYGANDSKSLIRRDAEKNHSLGRTFAEWRVGRHKKNLAKVSAKYDKKIAEQKQAYKDLDAQAKKHSKDTPQVRDVLNAAKIGTKEKIGKLEAKKKKKVEKYESKRDAQAAANANLQAYRDHSDTAKLYMRSAAYEHARARGSSRTGAVVESLDPTGIIRMRRNKKAYGKYIVFGDNSGNDYNAMAIDRD